MGSLRIVLGSQGSTTAFHRDKRSSHLKPPARQAVRQRCSPPTVPASPTTARCSPPPAHRAPRRAWSAGTSSPCARRWRQPISRQVTSCQGTGCSRGQTLDAQPARHPFGVITERERCASTTVGRSLSPPRTPCGTSQLLVPAAALLGLHPRARPPGTRLQRTWDQLRHDRPRAVCRSWCDEGNGGHNNAAAGGDRCHAR